MQLIKNTKLNLIVAIITIITVVLWIAGDMYHIYATSTIPQNVAQLLTPFDPTLDKTIFEKLKKKKAVADFVLSPTNASQSATITVTPTINSATPSSNLNTND